MKTLDYVTTCEIAGTPIIAVLWQHAPGYGMIAWPGRIGNSAGMASDGQVSFILSYWPDFYICMTGQEANDNAMGTVWN